MIATTTPVEVKKTQVQRAAPDIWQSFRGEIDRLFDQFSLGFPSPAMRRMFNMVPLTEPSFVFAAPAVDVNEDEKSYTITAELPGLDEKNVDVTVSGDLLVIKGEKRQEKEEKDKNRYLSERSYGAFQRAFALPSGVDSANITANFAKGVLTVTLPKTVAAQQAQKKIEVKAA